MKTIHSRSRHFTNVIIFVMTHAGFLSCAPTRADFDKPYRADVIHFVAPTGTDNESWEIETKELQTLEDVEKVRGKYFEIITGGSVKIDSSTGSLTIATSTKNEASLLRAKNRDGIIVAKDSLALNSLSAFHAFEELLLNLDAVIPLDADGLLAENGTPLKIFMQPTLIEKDGLSQTILTPKLNAAFNPQSNEFYLLKSSELEKIPLAANKKVIAHEFGHLLFKRAFDGGRSYLCDGSSESLNEARLNNKTFPERWSVEYSISGLNEGYADFVSFVFTKSEDALKDAFSDAISSTEKKSRSLSGQQFTFDQLGDDDTCSGRFYCIGTLFARSLYRIAKNYNDQEEERKEFSHRVHSGIAQVQGLLQKKPFVDILPLPSKEVAGCLRRSEANLPYDGKVTSAFLAAFLSTFPAGDEQSALCQAFKDLFGDTGFNAEARSVCSI